MKIFGLDLSKFFGRWVGGARKHHPETMAALEKWADQFLSDAGALVMAMAIEYGPKLVSGQITMQQAKTEILAKFKEQGIAESKELVDLIFNALRTLKPVV